MNGILVIAGKDLRSVFYSSLFYIIAGICALVWSFLFYLGVSQFVSQNMMQMLQGGGEGSSLHFTVIARHISLVNLVMIFAVSSFTVRLFTEEKRQRTFDLLLTSPVTATQIAVGKLIAGILTAWALVGLSLLYPMSLSMFGHIEWGPLASSYIGLLLLTATYVSIGMFASSLTTNTALSVIMALIFNVMLWFLGAAADASENPTQKSILEHLNVGTHFVNFLKGNFSIAGVVFFLSAIFVFTFLTQRVVESARWR
jgi:ABC-2 type transport system permease protein